jgi:hypothetical protein
MDPIGTVRREDHHDDGEASGYTIWVRMQPTYPDDQLPDTEWTCVWSTAPGNIGVRFGDSITEHSEIVGAVRGTPAETGSDVQIGDRVQTLPNATYWTEEPLLGRIVPTRFPHTDPPTFTVEFDRPQTAHLADDVATYTHWSMGRLGFRLLETDFDESTED